MRKFGNRIYSRLGKTNHLSATKLAQGIRNKGVNARVIRNLNSSVIFVSPKKYNATLYRGRPDTTATSSDPKRWRFFSPDPRVGQYYAQAFFHSNNNPQFFTVKNTLPEIDLPMEDIFDSNDRLLINGGTIISHVDSYSEKELNKMPYAVANLYVDGDKANYISGKRLEAAGFNMEQWLLDYWHYEGPTIAAGFGDESQMNQPLIGKYGTKSTESNTLKNHPRISETLAKQMYGGWAFKAPYKIEKENRAGIAAAIISQYADDLDNVYTHPENVRKPFEKSMLDAGFKYLLYRDVFPTCSNETGIEPKEMLTSDAYVKDSIGVKVDSSGSGGLNNRCIPAITAYRLGVGQKRVDPIVIESSTLPKNNIWSVDQIQGSGQSNQEFWAAKEKAEERQDEARQ